MSNDDYTAPGKNNGYITLYADGDWVKVQWNSADDRHESILAVPKDLLLRFVHDELEG